MWPWYNSSAVRWWGGARLPLFPVSSQTELEQGRRGWNRPVLHPRLLFVFTCPCVGLMLFSVPRLQPWLTGPCLFMPFALIIWAGLSAGRVAAILRVAKWHSGVHWWKGLHAYTQGGEATGSLKGTTKRGDVKSSQGEKAWADCVSEGERRHNLWHHTVYLVAVMHEFGAHRCRANVWTFLDIFLWHWKWNE